MRRGDKSDRGDDPGDRGKDAAASGRPDHDPLIGAVERALPTGRAASDQEPPNASPASRPGESTLFERLFEAAPLIVLVLDSDGRIVRFNPYLESLSGHRLEEVRGKDWFSTFLPPAWQSSAHRVFDRAISGSHTRGNINPILTKTGELREIEWHDTTIHGAGGQILGIVAFGLDITERRRLEQESLQAQKLEAIGRLASGVAHDFNNLLMAITGCADMARRQLAPDAPALDYLDEIKQVALSGAAITRQLLAFGRRDESTATVIELDSAIARCEGMLRRLIGEQIEFRVRLGSSGKRVLCQEGHIEQIVLNLAVNARDAMPDGGCLTIESGAVDLTAADLAEGNRVGLAAGRYLTVTVSDTGVGMDESTRGHLFEPFYTTKQQRGGTGLGLSTVYGIVKGYGGHIEVATGVGEGSTFTVFLPRHEDVDGRGDEVSPVVPSGGSETVLLVEDELLVRITVRHYLEEAGYTVLDAGNGKEAVEVCRAHPGSIDLLITDIVLPGSLGTRVARDIEALRPGIRVLFMSAYPRQVLARSGRFAAAGRVLRKPFGAVQLLEQVRAIIERTEVSEDRPSAGAGDRPGGAVAADDGSRTPGQATLLLIEDHEITRVASRELLEEFGYRVLDAGDGARAFELLAEHGGAIDLVMTDLSLPDLSGEELVARFDAIGEALPVVFVSGHDRSDPAVRRAMRRKNSLFFQKPIDLPRVAAGIESLLES